MRFASPFKVPCVHLLKFDCGPPFHYHHFNHGMSKLHRMENHKSFFSVCRCTNTEIWWSAGPPVVGFVGACYHSFLHGDLENKDKYQRGDLDRFRPLEG
jgi:hypothetical protein